MTVARDHPPDVAALYRQLADVVDARREPWRDQAACRELGVPTAAFFPPRGQRPDRARGVCAGCPVRAECLDFALRSRDHHGVFAGTTDKDRRPLARERRGVERRERAS